MSDQQELQQQHQVPHEPQDYQQHQEAKEHELQQQHHQEQEFFGSTDSELMFEAFEECVLTEGKPENESCLLPSQVQPTPNEQNELSILVPPQCELEQTASTFLTMSELEDTASTFLTMSELEDESCLLPPQLKKGQLQQELQHQDCSHQSELEQTASTFLTMSELEDESCLLPSQCEEKEQLIVLPHQSELEHTASTLVLTNDQQEHQQAKEHQETQEQKEAQEHELQQHQEAPHEPQDYQQHQEAKEHELQQQHQEPHDINSIYNKKKLKNMMTNNNIKSLMTPSTRILVFSN